jgi:hypothetical protein
MGDCPSSINMRNTTTWENLGPPKRTPGSALPSPRDSNRLRIRKYLIPKAGSRYILNSRTFVLIAGVLALIGLIVNAALDLDNVYDMSTTALWLLTVIFAFLGAFVGRNK